MKQKTLQNETCLTLAEACERYIENCRQRNLSEFTILHYKESYEHFYKFFGAEMLLSDMDKENYDAFLGYLRTVTSNDGTIRCYQRNLMTVLRYLMREGYTLHMVVTSLSVLQSTIIETDTTIYSRNSLILNGFRTDF